MKFNVYKFATIAMNPVITILIFDYSKKKRILMNGTKIHKQSGSSLNKV